MKYEQVKTEYTHGKIGHADYGSKVRVLMRSKDYVMFVGYGVHIWKRGTHNSTNTMRVAAHASKDGLSGAYARETIERVFGTGSYEKALCALVTRNKGTILVDGGGEPLLPPSHIHRKMVEEEYAAISPTVRQTINGKTCLQCGNSLKPHTVTHHLHDKLDKNSPKTLEDCQKFSNQPVIAVHGFGINKSREYWSYISWFETWDGESYVKEPFCSDRCAMTYGLRAAAELPHLPVGGEAKINTNEHESVRHYQPSEHTMTVDGKIFKI